MTDVVMTSADWVIGKLLKNPSCQSLVNDAIRPYYLNGIQKTVYERIITYIEEVPKRDKNYEVMLDSNNQPILETRIAPTFSTLVDGDPKIGDYVSYVTSKDEISDTTLNMHLSNITGLYKQQSLAKAFQLGIDRIAENRMKSDDVAAEVMELVNLSLMAENEKPYISQSEAVEDFKKEFEKERSGERPRISTGFKTFDYILQGGLARGDFLVVASGTGQGKSTMANQLMLTFQKFYRCGMVGLEMDHKEYIRRQISTMAGLFNIPNLSQAHLAQAHRKIDEDAYKVITEEISKFDITYLTTKDVSIADLKKHFKILLEKYKCEVFFLDHMLLVSEQNMEERHKINEVANFMKKFAAEHNVLCVAVSQMNRDTDLSDPQVKDLSGGRGLEHAATSLISIGLPSKKQNTKNDFIMNIDPDPSLRVIRLMKSRNSGNGLFHADFDGNSSLFSERLPANWEECENGHYGKEFEYSE